MRNRAVALLVIIAVAIAGVLLYRHYAPPHKSGAAAGEFALVDAAERSLDGSPALALTFSQPLDARKSHDKLIEVYEMPLRPGETRSRPEQSGESDDTKKKTSAISIEERDVQFDGGTKLSQAWVVGDNPRILYFPHVKPESRYVVRVQPGIVAASGATLGAEARYSVTTNAISPAYYFASKGVVLPAKQNGGLPVVTVNVPEVDIQFLRVKPAQLARFLDRMVKPPRNAHRSEDDEAENDERVRVLTGAVDNYQLDELRKFTDSIYLGRFLTEQKANKRSVTYIPVEDIKELKEPGIYVAIMSEPGRFRYDYQTTYFYVSDLGLHTRLFEKTADAYVSSLTDARAVQGVEIQWLDEQGKVLARGATDADGRAAFAERPQNARLLLARKGEQVSMIALREPALDLSEHDVLGMPYKAARLFAYTGRNLYRPGETFEVSVMARNPDGRPVPSQPIQAVLKRPDGKVQFTATWAPDKSFGGYYQRRIELPADAATGFWSLELRTDPADKLPGTVMRFGVEEFLPERMKLDLKTAAPLLKAGETYAIDASGAYLYGAPADGNRLLGVVLYERNRNPLAAKLPGFEFGDADEDSDRTRKELQESALDAKGNAKVDVDMEPVAGRDSPFLVRTTISLLESGGRPVVRSLERIHWPAATLVGIRPLFGDYARENSSVEFEVVRADAEGNLKAALGLPVRLYREDRHYYWRFEDQRGWHSGYTETDELVESTAITAPAGGRGVLKLPVKYGRYRIEIIDPDTKLVTRYRFYAGWSARADEANGIRPDRVAVKLDKAGYVEGDTAQVMITPPHGGDLLLTVEGDRTLWVKRASISQSGSTIAVPIDKAWLRHDLYVTATVLRPGNEGDRVTPARALGVAHVPLARAERKLAVAIEATAKTKPEMPLKVKIKAPAIKGQPAVVTLYAVDAGILNITNYKTPDPHAFYFAKLRYGADLHDVYGRVIEKMPGSRGRLKFGGDNTPKPTRSLPKKVKLVDLFSGPVALDANGEAEVTLPLPDFNGSLRLMAVVAAADRFGSQEAEVVVAAPLVAELLTPRFLTIGDSATIALDLHNLSGTEQALSVAVIANDGLRAGDAQRQVTLKDQQKTTLRFPIEAGSAFGLAEVRVKVDSPAIKLERQFGLEVVAATPRQQTLKRYVVEPGETVDVRDAELSGFMRPTVLSHLALSDQPPIDVRSAVRGLLTYPYGCGEQTTSTAYPHLFIDEAAAKRFGLKPFTREQRVEMIDKAIGRLSALQAPNGGYSLWGQVSDYEYWLSAYIGQFLLDAREQGFGVPEAMQRKTTDFLLRGLQEGVSGLPILRPDQKPARNDNAIWSDRRYAGSGRFAVLAYGGYVLARESKAPLATLRQLHESRGHAHSGLSLVQLGVALRLMGDETRGDQAIAEGLRKPRESGWWGDYGSVLRDAALSYALLAKHKSNATGREILVSLVAGELSRPDQYLSTQDKLAVYLIGREFDKPEAQASWSARIGTTEVMSTGTHYQSIAAGELASGVKITNTHKQKLYLELSVAGNPAKMPVAAGNDFDLKRSLHAADGSPLPNRNLRVGEAVIVQLVVKAKTRIANGLVVDRIPAGLEIENMNLVQGEGTAALKIDNVEVAEAMRNPRIQHVEFRDDRFVAAVKLEGETRLYYRARVVTPGKFVVPPVYVEDMYRPQLFGIAGGGDTLTLVDANSAK